MRDLKRIILPLMAGSLLMGWSFANENFSERLYCQLGETSVRVYLLQEEETFKCTEYRRLLDSYLRREYSSIMQVIANMNRGDDVEYRRALYEEKKQLFFKLFSQIKLIENAVSDFQSNLLVRSQEFIRDELTKKRQEFVSMKEDYEQQLLQSPYSTFLPKKIAQLKDIEGLIERLLTTKEMDIFVRDLGQYLTLSMQIVS